MQRICNGCGGEIPAARRKDAKYCSRGCKNTTGSKRHRQKDPEKTRQYFRDYNKNNPARYRKYYQSRKYGAVLEDMTYKEANAVKRGILYGYRSGLEETVAKQIEAAGHPVVFEADKFSYTWPARTSKYTPDFRITRKDGSVFYVETKGRFLVDDRQKHILLKETPNAPEIRFVFSRSKTKISKTSKTTYARWCEDHGFLYADKAIPEEWFNE